MQIPRPDTGFFATGRSGVRGWRDRNRGQIDASTRLGSLQFACNCGYYRAFPRATRIPVYSMLSAGGGRAVPSSGFVETDAYGRYQVFLPSAHGTSGTMIVDGQGRLVGLVWGVYSQVGAGFASAITPAPVIISLVKYAFDRDGVAYIGP